MRLIALFALAGLLVLAILPAPAMAGASMDHHACATCPDDMSCLETAEIGPACHDMGFCAMTILPEPPQDAPTPLPEPLRLQGPPDTAGDPAFLSIDLPPPRA